jgi:cobalt transporter subunit CbtA
MELFRRIFLAAVLAGAVAGLALSAIEQWRVVPLILEAETYETGSQSHSTEAAGETLVHASGEEHSHDVVAIVESEPDGWAPGDGLERTLYTVLATTLASIGFALVVAAISALTGLPVTVRNGVIWGLGGYAAFSLAPAFGLPPELPGMPAADLAMRQVWWWATALATGAGILLIAWFRTWQAIVAGIVFIALPHLIGAPAAPEEHSGVPAHLATAFAASALAASMIFWIILGPLMGRLNERFGASEAV